MDAREFSIKQKRITALLKQYAKQKLYFSGNPAFQAESAQYRQELVESLVLDIRQNYVELSLLVDDEQQRVIDQLYLPFDETHVDFVGNIRQWIKKHKVVAMSTPSQEPEHQNSTHQNLKVKFPVISLPEFDGSLENWLEYRDTFESLVHTNASLSMIEKYHYLRTSIKLPSGRANILQHFTLSADSYQDAWTAVKERYNDKRKLKSQHFSTLLSIKKMTAESPAELRRVLDLFSSTITTLKQLGATYDDLLVHVVQFRLDEQTRKNWQNDMFDDEPTWQELNDYLKNQLHRLDQVHPTKKPIQKSADTKTSSHELVAKTKSFASNGQKTVSCSLCKENHRHYQCEKFKALSTYDRFQHVKKSNLCRNCLSSDHKAMHCKCQGRCRSCNRNHHTLLHFNNASSSSFTQAVSENHLHSSPGSASSFGLNPHAQSYSQQNSRFTFLQPKTNLAIQSFLVTNQALLSTVSIKVKDAYGNEQICRALIDSGSMINYMTTAAAQRLGLKKMNAFIPITGMNDKTSIVRHTVQANFSSKNHQYEKSIQCSVLDNVTGFLPMIPINFDRLTIPDNIVLADPEFYRPAPVDMLLGITVHLESQLEGNIRIPEGLILQQTLFGWIIGGEQDERTYDRASTSAFFSCFAPEWQIDEQQIDPKSDSFHLALSEATNALTQAAIENKVEFPEAAKVIKDSFSMSDLMVGFDSIDQALKIRNHLRYLLSRSHSPLLKCATNDERNLHSNDIEDIRDDQSSIKFFEYNWFPRKDRIALCFKQSSSGITTKASILSKIASMYDPLGIIGPLIKILWQNKLSLKQEVPEDFADSWNNFRRFIFSISDAIVSRTITISNPHQIELHGFCDASENAHGVVVYVRSADFIDDMQVSLVYSKSRVSSTKQQTIARLESSSAVFLSKLISRIVSISSLESTSINLWSDSMTTLHWIRAHSSRLSTFVGNRAAVIQDLTKNFIFRHIRNEDSPADAILRNLLLSQQIQSYNIWWNDSTFISQSQDNWLETLVMINEDDSCYTKEFRNTFHRTQDFHMLFYIETNHSRLDVFINSYFYMEKFKLRASKGAIKTLGFPTIEEREQTTLIIIRILQQTLFESPRKFSSLSLAPFMDKVDRINRVGGRLQASSALTYNQNHPITLLDGHFAKFIFRDAHIQNMQQRAQAPLSTFQQQHWMIHAQLIIRKIIYDSIVCFKVRPNFVTQYMASLPEARVIMTSPPTTISVDYARYFNIRSSLTIKNTIVKPYVAKFKCTFTGAIHLEAVTNLSIKAFITAYDRFISQRGIINQIFSGNETIFVSFENEFKKTLKESKPSIAAHQQGKFNFWHFTTSFAPQAGGYYVSEIKANEQHLERTTQENSRLLTTMSEDPTDLQILTSDHFISVSLCSLSQSATSSLFQPIVLKDGTSHKRHNNSHGTSSI